MQRHGSVSDAIAAEANALVAAGSEPREVTDEELREAAAAMARRGYVLCGATVDALRAYLQGYGILLNGDVGTGKTVFFRALPRRVERICVLGLSAKPLDEIRAEIEALDGREVVLDDIGAEPVYNNYGCRMDILPWIVEHRMGQPARTHFTTNVGSDKLAARYGARLVDRICGLCRAFTLAGGSRRKAHPNVEAIKAMTPRRYDWSLCAARCARFRDGRCQRGYPSPPTAQEWPQPPEECLHYEARAS